MDAFHLGTADEDLDGGSGLRHGENPIASDLDSQGRATFISIVIAICIFVFMFRFIVFFSCKFKFCF